MNVTGVTAQIGLQRGNSLLTVEEAAQRLGLRPTTVRDWLWRRKIEHIRVGERAIRIRESVVEEIIARGTVPARRP